MDRDVTEQLLVQRRWRYGGVAQRFAASLPIAIIAASIGCAGPFTATSSAPADDPPAVNHESKEASPKPKKKKRTRQEITKSDNEVPPAASIGLKPVSD